MKSAILSALAATATAAEVFHGGASQCLGSANSYGHDPTCLPSWKPSACNPPRSLLPPSTCWWRLTSTWCVCHPFRPAAWDMKRSTVLYTCNNTGMHDVTHAIEYGTVVYDWSK
jgi:hypothetical protein